MTAFIPSGLTNEEIKMLKTWNESGSFEDISRKCLFGRDSNDMLWGTDFSDHLYGGAGTEYFDGGKGNAFNKAWRKAA